MNALIAADGKYNASRSAKQAASDAFKPKDVALSEWLQVTRNILAARFGNRWSTMWAQAGFTDATTRVPGRIEGRLGLALSLAGFFTANPTFEVKSMDVTATKATALRDAANTARQAVLAADVVIKTDQDARDAAYETFVGSMRSLVRFLDGTLQADDPRWLAFGLEMPSMNTTPGKPLNVRVMVDEAGDLIVECDPPALAMRFRWRMLLVGVETDYRLVARSVDPMAKITGAMPGTTVQIIVQAVNGNSQGVASDPIIFSVPPVARAEAATASREEATISSNGNGSNGHATGSRRPALV